MMCKIEKNDKGKVKVRWHCPFCQESFGFHLHDVEVMDIFVVRHLMVKHNQTREEISAYEPYLQEAVAYES